jgi:hypothetical protein
MTKTLATIATLPAVLFLLAACADFKISDAGMTRADVKVRESAINGGFAVSDRRIAAIIADTPSLSHLK